MKKIKFYLQRIYRLALGYKKQEELVWKELKKIHDKANWKHGIFEKEKFIETMFALGEGEGGTFYYMIYDRQFHCKVRILENFPTELTTDLFVLATHFNNVLNNGIVKVSVRNCFVEYHQKQDLLIPLLYSGETYEHMKRHLIVSEDIYAAFLRLIIEQEAPAIIIADLLNRKDSDASDIK